MANSGRFKRYNEMRAEAAFWNKKAKEQRARDLITAREKSKAIKRSKGGWKAYHDSEAAFYGY